MIDLPLDYLNFEYGVEIVRKWILSLNIFRICTIYPYPNDLKPVRLVTSIQFTDEKELQNILTNLNLETAKTKPENSQFHDENENISVVWILLNNEICYLDVNKILKKVHIEVSGTKEDQFGFDETVVERGKRIETFLSNKDFSFIDPPQDDKYCISPTYYPFLWID